MNEQSNGRPPRVLLIARSYPPGVGGMERFSYHLATALSPLVRETLLANRRGKAGLPVFLPYAMGSGAWLAQRKQVDVIHLCDGLLAPVGATLKKLTGATVTATVHGLDLTYENKAYQAALERSIPALDGLIAVSTSTATIARQRWPALADRVTVVPNGVDFSPADAPVPTLPAALQSRLADRRVLLTVGRLVKRKGAAWFVRNVLPCLPDDVAYAIAGAGPEQEAIAAAAAQAGVSDRVVLLGRVPESDLEALYRHAELFVMPNIVVPGDVEGFGLVALEAASRGLPVVAADLEGIPEAIRDGRNGYLVPPEDVAAWTKTLHSLLLLLPEERRELGCRFQAYTAENFSWQRTAAAYVAAFSCYGSRHSASAGEPHNSAPAAVKSSHAVLDRPSRERKARRIAELLEEQAGSLSTKDLLDVGTGAGYIASYLAGRARSLLSVDVVDQRLVHDFRFQQVTSERLPCEAESLDVVISNHVIEHVDDQRTHLQEVARVLRRDGVCYLTTPNRWRLVEPHFKLPFLSWLPARLRDPYVRLARRGPRFDVQPLTYPELQSLARTAGLTCRDISPRMVELSLGARGATLLRLARPVWPLLRYLLPTFVVVLTREREESQP